MFNLFRTNFRVRVGFRLHKSGNGSYLQRILNAYIFVMVLDVFIWHDLGMFVNLNISLIVKATLHSFVKIHISMFYLKIGTQCHSAEFILNSFEETLEFRPLI